MFKKSTALLLWLALATLNSSAAARQERQEAAGQAGGFEIEVAGLRAPVAVVWTGAYRDGGTTAVLLKDAAGKHFLFCLEVVIADVDAGDVLPGAIFVGVRHPSNPPEPGFRVKRKLDAGGSEEAALLKLLRRWRDANTRQRGEEDFTDVSSVISRVEKREELWKEAAAARAAAEAAIGSAAARGLAEELIGDLVSNRRDAVRSKLDEDFYIKTYVNGKEKPWTEERRVRYFNYVVGQITEAYGLLGCELKSERAFSIRYYDDDNDRDNDRRRAAREFRYACRTRNRVDDNPRLVVEVVRQGDKLAVKRLGLNICPKGTPGCEKW